MDKEPVVKPKNLPVIWQSSEAGFSIYPFLYITLIANICALFFDPYGGDQGYWFRWVSHLYEYGYTGFPGNYPPLYVHWLYIVSKAYQLFPIEITQDILLKILTSMPVVFTHLLLVRVIGRVVQGRALNVHSKTIILLLTALNPALLIDGPIWGQVDILAVTLVVGALALAVSPQGKMTYLIMPLFCLSLACKFQMICFSPVFGVIFFRRWKMHLVGAVVGLSVIVLAFLPFLMVGEFKAAFENAYLKTTGQYPYATYNAANIWYLIAGNTTPDSLPLFDGFEALDYKLSGILFFFITCLSVFLGGLIFQVRTDALNSLYIEMPQVVLWAVICSISFFLFLPGMHERYLLPAVPVACLYAAYRPSAWYIPAGVSLWSFMNIHLILSFSGENVWWMLSLGGASLFFYLILKEFFGSGIERVNSYFAPFLGSRLAPEVLAFSILCGIIYYLVYASAPIGFSPEKDNLPLTDLRMKTYSQDWKRPRVNASASGSKLKVGGVYYSNGIGVHANSKIIYNLPENVVGIRGMAALDDMGRGGEVVFVILSGSQQVWESGNVRHRDGLQDFDVSLKGGESLTLQVQSAGSISHDHAVWLNIELKVSR